MSSGKVMEGRFVPSAEISEIMFCDAGQWPEGLPAVQEKLIIEILVDQKGVK